MPKPQPQQDTWVPRVTIQPPLAHNRPHTAQIGRARRWLLKACGSVAQALDHEGNGDATSTQVVAHPQDRAMPKPQPQQDKWAPQVTIPPSLAHTRPNRACAEMALEGVPERCSLFSGARAKHSTRRFYTCYSSAPYRKCAPTRPKASIGWRSEALVSFKFGTGTGVTVRPRVREAWRMGGASVGGLPLR